MNKVHFSGNKNVILMNIWKVALSWERPNCDQDIA